MAAPSLAAGAVGAAARAQLAEQAERQNLLSLAMRKVRDGPWLHAWYDPLAGVKVGNGSGGCIRSSHSAACRSRRRSRHACVSRTSRAMGTTSCWLLMPPSDSRSSEVCGAQPWSARGVESDGRDAGTSLMLEHQLLEAPCALAVFYSDTSTPRVPSVAVASGESCAPPSRPAPSHACAHTPARARHRPARLHLPQSAALLQVHTSQRAPREGGGGRVGAPQGRRGRPRRREKRAHSEPAPRLAVWEGPCAHPCGCSQGACGNARPRRETICAVARAAAECGGGGSSSKLCLAAL